MKRQDKYPNTEYFVYYNRNPKNKFTEDCVVRALSLATDTPYEQVVMDLARLSCETGYAFGSRTIIDKYLSSKGWIKHQQPRAQDNTKYTGKQFCKLFTKYPVIVASIGGHHISCVMEGKFYDTWDCTEGCVGNFWTK